MIKNHFKKAKCVVEVCIMQRKYIEVSLNGHQMGHKMKTTVWKNHNMHSFSVIKIQISLYDDKTHTQDDEIASYTYKI